MLSIFVSSTFSDMQVERDVIRQRILPRLQNIASKYGESVRIIDLRWGVDTTSMSEKQATEKILDVCFEQIDKCNGQMLCLLGNRYGWVPEFNISEISNRYGLKLADRISATELEIQYGILQRNHPQKAKIFIRNTIEKLPLALYNNFNDDDIRLRNLKEQLFKSKNCSCQNYSLIYNDGDFYGLDIFEELVFKELSEYINDSFSMDHTTQFDKLKNHFDAHIDKEVQNYYLLQQLDSSVDLFINNDNTYGLLKAEAGMGKTAFSSHMCSRWGTVCKFFYFFCGYNADSETPVQLLKYFNAQVSVYLGIKLDNSTSELKDNLDIFTYLLNKITEKVVFVIDGIDHLVCTYEEKFAWLPEKFPNHVKFFFTTTNEDRSYERLNQFTFVQLFEIPEIIKPEKFIKHLLFMNGKDIQDTILSSSLCSHQIKNFYYAKMIADALVMMDRYDFQRIKETGDDISAINRFLKNAINSFPKNVEGMALFLLHDYGQRIAPKLIPQVYKYIACNKGGLRATDLQKIFGKAWDDVSFERYIAFLSGIIIEKENGCYDFASVIIKKAVVKLIDAKDEIKILKYIETLPNDDPVKLRCCLSKALIFEHYDTIYELIYENQSSLVLIEQFIRCLRYMEKECTVLLKKYDLYDWFFKKVIAHTTSIQEREACVKVVLSNLATLPNPFKTNALEYLGDSFCQKGEMEKAEKFYKEANEEFNDYYCFERGRVLYKLANVYCVNSDVEYYQLKKILSSAIENFHKQERDLNIVDRMFYVVSKYQLLMLELNYAIKGVEEINETFSFKEMKLHEGTQIPYLKYITMKKIKEIHEANISLFNNTVNLYNEYNQEAKTIYQDALREGIIEKIIDTYILTFDIYDIFDFRDVRLKNLIFLKEELENQVKKKFSLSLYQTIGDIEYRLAQNVEDKVLRKKHLLKCCSIWGQFVSPLTKSNLPAFTEGYITAERQLVTIYLEEGNDCSVDEHLVNWSQARFYYNIMELRLVWEQCKRCPDEIHMAILNEVREEIADVQKIKTLIKQLRDNYERCNDINFELMLHWCKGFVFNNMDDFTVREKESFGNYQWLKNIYIALKDKLKQYPDEKDDIEYVCIYVLNLMLEVLNSIQDITNNHKQALSYSINQYYDDKLYVLEERIIYETTRLEKIWYGFMYAKTLMLQANKNLQLFEENYLFAIKVLTTVRLLLYENETTPFNPSYPTYPMIDLGTINFELCLTKRKLATYYIDMGRYLLAAENYEATMLIALSLMGCQEDSKNIDRLLIYIAQQSCLQALKIYIEYNINYKIAELQKKYEEIKVLNVV